MALNRLSNEQWGFSSNCFVCEPNNQVGLRQAFFHDTDASLVVAELLLGAEHSGAPAYVHGGVQLALLDEAMAWAAIAITEQFAVTASFGSTFHHPLRIGKQYRLEAAIGETTESTLQASARIVDDQDRVRTSATATLVVLSAAQATDAGAMIDESTKRWTR
ncbi:MAG: PaaI family thioesterase [Ilumatobacteraceae bacterium]